MFKIKSKDSLKIIRNDKKCIYNKLRSSTGITLIDLVITIIVLLILAGITMNLLIGENGIFTTTESAKFKMRMQELKEQTELYIADHIVETYIENSSFLQRSKINAGELLESMIGSENSPLDPSFTSTQITHTLEQMMKNIKSSEKEYIVIYEGEFCYVSQNSIPNNAEKVQWCKEVGIRILEYKEAEGIEKTNGDYENIDGIFMCTPDLSNFAKSKTRYLKLNEEGNLVTTQNFTSLTPDPEWYDYGAKKWANIYVESEGSNAYYVWIPRYAYKEAEGNVTGQERADVVFIDMENNHTYIDETTGEKKTKTWEQLESEGYTIPEAFGWGDNDDDRTANTQLPGYWISKYILGEIEEYPIQYDFTTEKEGIVITNITTNIEGIINAEGNQVTIGKYEFAINGKVTNTYEEKPEQYTFTEIKKGINTFTLTLLDENGEIIGSMTKEYEVTEANAPNLEGFDKQNTYYVTYDENENEHSTIPATEQAPENWYSYETRQWANIVVRKNGAETYYTWIPRYAYKTSGERATVRFLEGTTSEIPDEYIIPDAFGWGDDDDDRIANTQITGYWITKYVLGESNALDINTEYTTTSGTITTQGLTGEGITDGQKYIYWIDRQEKTTKTEATEKVTYEGLEAGKSYTILIEIRDNTTDALIGTITKEATTTTANAPDLTGFDQDPNDEDNTMTYYVTYGEDGTGEEDSSIPISEEAPSNWYNYAEQRWANIVVRKTNESGDTVAETYYTWIPRYAYREVTDQERADIIFLEETSSNIPEDYTIPDAFSWGDDDDDASNNTPIRGYWITKYVLGEM